VKTATSAVQPYSMQILLMFPSDQIEDMSLNEWCKGHRVGDEELPVSHMVCSHTT